MFRYLLLILSFGFFLSCANDKFETPSDLGKAFFNTLKEIEDEEDISILHKYFLTKEEYGEYLDLTGFSGNIERFIIERNRMVYERFNSEIFSDILDGWDSEEMKKLNIERDSLYKIDDRDEYKKAEERYSKRRNALHWKRYKQIMDDAEYRSFSRGRMKRGAKTLGINLIGSRSYIHYVFQDEADKIRIREMFKTKKGWKILEW